MTIALFYATPHGMSKVRFQQVSKDDQGMRLDRWFKRYVPEMTHVALQKALRKGQVRVDGARAKAGDAVQAGQEIRIPPVMAPKESAPRVRKPKAPQRPSDTAIERLKACLIYDDADMAVFNKPQGLAVQGGTGQSQSVDSILPFLWPELEERPKLVHRLDRDTTGVLLVAKNRTTAAKLTEAFRDKTTQKRYLAVVVGVPAPREGVIKLPITKGEGPGGMEKMIVDKKRGQTAITHYRVLDYAHNNAALVELAPVTGRTHQLRVHMAAIECPILGDGKYGGKVSFLPHAANSLHLHAYQLALPAKKAGKSKEFKAPLPEHIKETLGELGLQL